MKLSSFIKTGAAALMLASAVSHATGMVPETSVIIVEQSDGEGSVNVTNTDSYPVLMLSTLKAVPEDKANLLTLTPPAARVEAGKTQRVRFLMTDKTPLTTEHLMRVTFEGVPPQKKDQNIVRMGFRQNLPVIIRPAGLAKDEAPWKGLVWKQSGSTLTVSNPSPYVVRMEQKVQTLPDNATWTMDGTYVLPGQTRTLSLDKKGAAAGSARQVRIAPATTWGYSVQSYDAPLTH
ncbi:MULTISPECIES: fimbria/pilus chaperone family protein [unclassified Enterobacter cloacae complex]|uniref:fimbria/pilus chaperone family protein n=1 Tax=unclassified Enterobacter cloacae complex TaxID=2757714 RepID=UPI0018732615|nr:MULTISPECIES: fimbria/pilus chaperone family protein [unclassified Enterobacter cloacae complex]MBE4810070.1 fimbria/pilus periplasmic chaperone [Enterobacter cloacae complex sp. P44RS]MBE4827946.1 fimbria/pilus periplasmic chaperone [Enterobacter cloacae complex sp. P42RS]MBE4836252.1 fimbria/pilus periplasmic chaperone [Enterobacter cloacae complex sp. P46RS]MBE4839847.1 fimbria/pilus periplasmic chaperone [Enterobacter cloacae complex sp. P42C]